MERHNTPLIDIEIGITVFHFTRKILLDHFRYLAGATTTFSPIFFGLARKAGPVFIEVFIG